MTEWLSAEWFDQTRAFFAGQQATSPDVSARIQYQITGGPLGEVSFFGVVEKGLWQERAAGAIDGPDVTVTATWTDAAAMCRGHLDPNVAFMQGRLKVAGSMGVMIDLLISTKAPVYEELRRKVAGVTEF